jgi:O-antigen/teichoic acid export membrane protein
MGVIRKQSALSSVAIYAGIAVGFVLTLYVYPKFLNPDEIGLLRVLVDMAKLIAPFLLLGMPNTFVKYYPYFKESRESAAAFRLLSILVGGVGGLLSLILFWIFRPALEASFATNAPLLSEFFGWLPVLIFLIGGFTLLRAYYRSDLNITLPNVFESVVLKVFFIASVLLYHYLELGVEWLVYFYVIAHAVMVLGLAIAYYRTGNMSLSKDLGVIPPTLRKEMISYGLFVIANVVSGSMIINIDSWMLASLAGLSATGVYSIAMSLGVLIELPKRSVSQIAVPIIASNWKNGNLENIKEIYHKTSLNQLITGGVIFVLVWTNIDNLFDLIPNGDVYRAGKWVVFYIGLAKLFAIATGANIEILQVSDHYRYSLWIRTILVLSAVGLNYWLIPIYGITGAAMATAIAFFLNNLLLFFVLWAKLHMQPFRRVNAWALMWLILLYILGEYTPLQFDHPLVMMIIRSTMIGVVALILLLRFPFSDDLKGFVVDLAKRFGVKL